MKKIAEKQLPRSSEGEREVRGRSDGSDAGQHLYIYVVGEGKVDHGSVLERPLLIMCTRTFLLIGGTSASLRSR